MHELSVAASICDVIESSLGRITPLSVIRLTIGPLSGILPDSLTFVFPAVAQERGFGTPEMAIRETEIRAHCHGCEQEYSMEDVYTVCPTCGLMERKILSGDEFSVDEVELLEECHE